MTLVPERHCTPNAKPDVLERERQKLVDAETKIVALEQSLKAL